MNLIETLLLLKVWMFIISGWSWRQINIESDESPQGRREAIFLPIYHLDSILLFGGRSGQGIHSDTWIFNITDLTWQEIQLNNEQRPPPTFSMVGGYDEENQIIYITTGERANDEVTNETWRINVENLETIRSGWEVVQTTGDPPAPLYGASGGYAQNSLFLTHGFDKSTRYDQTYYLNLTDFDWKLVAKGSSSQGGIWGGGGSSNEGPFARCLHGGGVWRDGSLVLSGGCGSFGFGPCPASDTWILDSNFGSRNLWNWNLISSSCAGAKVYPTVFPLLDSTEKLFVSVGGGGRIYGNDVRGSISLINGDKLTVDNILPSGDALPSLREASHLISIPNDYFDIDQPHALIMFGGQSFDDGFTNDLWLLTGNSDLNDDDVNQLPCRNPVRLWLIHGILMFLAWGFFLPLGITIARFTKTYHPPLWFKLHRVFQSLGVILGVAGFIVAVVMVPIGAFQALPHAAFGIIVTLIGIQQPINAYFRPHKDPNQSTLPGSKKPWNKRRIWEYCHKYLGRFGVVLAMINIYLGLSIVRASFSILLAYVIWTTLLIGFWVTMTFRRTNIIS